MKSTSHISVSQLGWSCWVIVHVPLQLFLFMFSIRLFKSDNPLHWSKGLNGTSILTLQQKYRGHLFFTYKIKTNYFMTNKVVCAFREFFFLQMKRKYDHITRVIYELHWLPLESRVQYKLAVLAFRHFEGTLLTCLLCSARTNQLNHFDRLLKDYWNLPVLILIRPVNAIFILLLRLFGIRFKTASVTYICFLSSKSNLKLIFVFKLFGISADVICLSSLFIRLEFLWISCAS